MISARVGFGPDIREGVAEWNGEGETVGGIVVMRYGPERAERDRRRQAASCDEIAPSLPPGVEIVPATIAPD